MRWLLIKDLQILRRSPLLVGMLIVYPVAIALMMGFALSSPPGKPKVAFYSGVAPGQGKISFGSQQINISSYAKQLFKSVEEIKVASAAQAEAKVRSGAALAAVIVPPGITAQIESLIRTGVGAPTVQLVLNSRDPLERQYVQDAISARLTDVDNAVSKQVLRVAVTDLEQVLNGGVINLLGQDFHLLGLKGSRAIVQHTVDSLPRGSALAAPLRQVAGFAGLAIEGLSFARPVVGSLGNPLTVQQTQLAGKTTPSDTYAIAIAAVVSLMFVTLLLAAGLLALERSENAYARLVRGLISPARLLGEKIVLAAGCGAGVTLVMAAFVSLFVHLEWSRFELWVLALSLGGLAFGALGVAIGALARELSAASLMAFLLSLPIAFVALVPSDAVAGGVKTSLDLVAFVFPFRAALQAIDNALAGTSPSIALPLLHLAALAIAFGALGRLALRRFGAA